MHLLARPHLICTALLVAALALAACGDDDGASSGRTASTPTTPTSSTPAASDLDGALWPDPARATEEATPADVARSFVEDFIGIKNPAFGDFQQGDSRSGEVQVMRRGENGTVLKDRAIATIAVRQLDGVRWFVIAAMSDDIEIEDPGVPAQITSPVRIAGRGMGFEGNVVLGVHAAFDPKPLAEKPVIAGSTKLEPFSAQLAFERPPGATGAIVARSGGGLAGADPFAAIGVRFAAAP